MKQVEEWLKQKAAQIEKGERVYITARNLLMKFGFEVKNESTIRVVRKALSNQSLKTSPQFWAVNSDSMVDIVKSNGENSNEKINQAIITFGMLKTVEIQKEMRSIDNKKTHYPKWYVEPNDNIHQVAAILAEENVDFVPVGKNENEFTGVISWDNIANSVDHRSRDRRKVKCQEIARDPIFVSESDSVYDKKQQIIQNGYVIVRDDNERSFAILRAQDLAGELLSLTENFLLLQEIENIIRLIIEQARPTPEEINAVVREDNKGKGATLNDLTFSEYQGIILYGPVKEKLKAHFGFQDEVIRQIAIEHIGNVRRIRNKVLHFHPDENNRTAKLQLTNTREFLRSIAEDSN